MIQSKTDLDIYLAKDRYALGISKNRPSFLGDEIWKYEIVLRKLEFYRNCGKSPLDRICFFWYSYRHHALGIKLGFSIPPNVFGAGLRINHYGTLVVNPKARIGEFCDIQADVNIGENFDRMAPVIGDDVWIGPGAKLFGGIEIADGTVIGANAVVNKSVTDKNCVVAGVPAEVISNHGNPYRRSERYLQEHIQ